ncbi:tail fiber domain-containing protein [Segatella copri]|uniref:tail fiber domain-containing protein n=1 Tax=Segatella copri TaxID=165179 RepID=UPI00294AF26D|nr:tail fiber domain-containing protein [Segatella copri]
MIETKIIVKPKGNSGTGNGSGASGYGGEYVSEADYAARAGKAKKAESADLAMRANTANTADRAKYADKAGELDEEAEVLKRYIRKDIDDIAQGTVTWEKVQKLLSGLLIGNSNNENGGSWTPDAEGRSHLITDYLEVRMKAIFEELVINKTSTIGGKEIISPTGGVVAHKVEEVTVTYNNVSQKAYRCYFLAEQDGDEVDNDFAVNDQVRSESFNVRKGTYHKAGNHFYWRLVIGRDEDPVELEGKKYHYIDLSDTDCATASDVPAKGDVLNQCGNRTDVERQNCLIFSAVDTYSPSISLYHGINSYSFANREYVEYGVNKQNNKAFFNVYGDMYVGDRPTKENGYEGSSYIRYDSSTKQLSVKGKISAKSTVDGKELSQYIKENTDDTIANAAKKAAEDAQKAAQTAQTDITNLGKTVTGNKKEFDNYVTDGYLEPSEIAAMAQDSKRLEDDFAAAQKSYNEVKKAEVLTNTKELTDLDIAFTTLTTAKKELIKYLSDISARYNAADTNYKATIVSAVGTKFTNFQSAYSAFYDKLGLANAYITSKIYGDLKQNITDLAGYKYLKDALGQTTDIDGGLVMTTLLALRDGDGNVQSGINGAIDPNRGQKSIATWWGGQMVDKDYNNGNLTPATSLIRFDGSGYLANGAIWWDVSGKVHADPTSFIISEKNLGAYLIFFEPTWKEGSAGTSVADLVSLKPNAPFSKLGVSGDATFEGAISFHGIKITYDATNKAIKIDGNLYATGGITAYGAGASTTGGGGGLNGSVKSYSNALKLTSESLSEIASAYSIKALDSRISRLEGGSAMDISVSGSGNAVTAISKSGTTISVTKGTTFLTSHQSLASYLTRTDAASLYQPKGNYLTSHQSLADYAKKTEIPTTLPANGGNSDTVDNEHASNFSYTHQSSFDFSKIKSGRIVTFDQSNTDYGWINGFASTHADYLTSVIFNTHRTSNWYVGYIEADKSTGLTNGLSAVRQLAFLDSKVADSDKLDGIHANELFTNLSNSNNGISVTIGGTTKSVSNISVNHASNADTALKVYGQVADTGFHELVRCDMNTDQFRIIAGSSGSNNGWAEIATADDGNEPIYVRQYSGVFSSVVRTLTLLDANGYTHFPSYINIGGNENNNSSPDRVWGSNSSDSYLRSYRTSALSVANADTVDGVHASGLLTDVSNSNNGVSITVGGTTKSISNISVNYAGSAGNADTVDGYHATSGRTFDGNINWSPNWNDAWSDGTNKHPWYGFDHRYPNTGAYSTTITDYFGMTIKTFNTLRLDFGTLLLNGTDIHNINVASATKLATARSIWGQSFDGTGNVNGTIYINNSNSSNGAIRLNSDISSNARISAIDDQVIFNTGNAIRFGETAWNWNNWAGLKYTHSNKTIYLGIANGSAFNANSAQSDGTLRLAGIKTVTPDSGARIGNSGADLYLGNASNSAWVKVQDICSQTNSSLWSIRQNGNAYFNSININSGATFNGPVKVNNMLTARGIMFTTADSNAYGTSLQNWDGSIGAHVTNMFNGIDSNNISMEYSTNGGSSWLTYTANPNYLFNLINDNSDTENFFLGNNVMSGSSDADKLTQIKKNQLRVTIKIPPEVYQELAWISVDVNNGVSIKCQVYLGNSSGVYTEYVSKVLIGWSHRCDICVGPLNVNVGNDSYRYVRLVFSHLSSHTSLRNGIVSRIRALALTKYNNGSGRYNISTTGHIYNYDYNMNTYFPNSILAKGGVTAYHSSDIRLKQDLRKLDYLGIIKAMGGTFGFAWKKDNTRSIGWIAQHVLCNPHLKDIVETDEKGYYKINYWSPKLIATAFGAIEQVGDEVSRLKALVVFLESEVQRLSGDKEDCNKKRLDNKNINSLN